jgi:hypothetical protein
LPSLGFGCIRLKDNVLQRLRVVPVGTPIDIVGSPRPFGSMARGRETRVRSG